MSIIMDPIAQPIAAGADVATYYNGELLIKSNTAGKVAKSAGIADVIVGIVDKDSVNVRGIQAATQSGQKIAIWLLNCGKVVDVRSVVSKTYNPGDVIYASATAGCATTDHATSRPIGHYPFWMAATVVGSSGDQKVPCLLDIAQDATLVGA
jgi:hypothetical protein